jgi:shikimate dehydrogenase
MSKKFLVVGNPIEHSLSPKLHSYWMKKNNIDAVYESRLIKEDELKKIVLELREDKINGANITLPFKKTIIPFLDELSTEAKISYSVNTIYKKKNKIVGDNTDIFGFQTSLKNVNQVVKNKKVFILGAGGVVSSIIIALKKLGALKIFISNRTDLQALELKKKFPGIEVITWGKTIDFDVIINATSLGLNEKDEINLNYEKISKGKFFYDVIYNPKETNFLRQAKKFGAKVENGKMMFVYQAQKAFLIWHNILPLADDETVNLLDT